MSKKEDECGDLAWNKTCDWLLLARGNLTQFQNDPVIETVSPEGTFCDTVQVPSNGGDMELI